MLFGAHVSIAGGLDKAITNGSALGANAIQTFATSPRMIKFTPVPETAIERYLWLKDQSEIKLHVFHGNYLINLASENLGYVAVCVETLTAHQQLAAKIGALGTIFHVGSHKGRGFEAVAEQVAQAIAQVLKASPKQVFLILENTAGQNGPIGASLSELKTLQDYIEKLGVETANLGIGIDSQHAFGSGYDLTGLDGVNQLVADVEQTFGIDKLKVIHLNDSLVPYNSKRDRHANLGEGLIGLEGLKLLVNHPKLKHLPFILEVPGKDKSGPRKEDINILKGLEG